MKEIYYDSPEYDALAISSIKPDLCDEEPDLYLTKWWDYRLLHPTQSTYLFADAYIAASRVYAKRNLDLEYGKVFKPYPGKDLFAKKELLYTPTGKVKQKSGRDAYSPAASKTTISGLWRARQMADRYGIPYRFYCESAIEYTEKGIWHRLPSPSHLYSTKKRPIPEGWNDEWRDDSMVDHILKRWSHYCKGTIVFSDNPYYQAAQNVNAMDQLKHRANLMTQIRARSNPKLGLCHALFEAKVLIEKECIAYFGLSTVESSKNYFTE